MSKLGYFSHMFLKWVKDLNFLSKILISKVKSLSLFFRFKFVQSEVESRKTIKENMSWA